MRALVCREFGPIEALRVEDVPSPVPAAGQVVIAVEAASVNFPDALIVQGKYQVRPPLPFVPGAELAGTVKSVGAGVRHLREGDRVLAVPMRGAFAEEVLVGADTVLPLDRSIDPHAAAAMPMTYATAYHALRDRASLQPGETLLVLGAGGGVGLAAVELGSLLGATVIAAASTQAKLAAARDRGADHLIDYATEDLRTRLKELTGGRGVDVVCDPVGGAHTESALRSTAWRGRHLVIGFAAGEIPRIALNLPLLKGSSLVGVFWGEFLRREPERAGEELGQLLRWLGEGRIRPYVSARYALADAVQALAAVYAGRSTGKVLVVP